MTVFKIILPVALLGLAGCVPTTQATFNSSPPVLDDPGGAGPAPGRTATQREARKEYYRGPRGDEF